MEKEFIELRKWNETPEKEFNLSEKMDEWFKNYNDMGEEWQIPKEELEELKNLVKEFIKLVKEVCDRKLNACYVKEEIDKLAGDKLNGNSVE